jgi:hypothetical protein
VGLGTGIPAQLPGGTKLRLHRRRLAFMGRTLVALTLFAAAATVLAAGCGGSGGYGGGSPTTTAAPTTSGAGTPGSGTAVAIDNLRSRRRP